MLPTPVGTQSAQDERRQRMVRFDSNLNEVAVTHAPEDYSRSDPAYFDEDNVIDRHESWQIERKEEVLRQHHVQWREWRLSAEPLPNKKAVETRMAANLEKYLTDNGDKMIRPPPPPLPPRAGQANDSAHDEDTSVELDVDQAMEAMDDTILDEPRLAAPPAPQPPLQDRQLLDRLAEMQQELNRLRELHNDEPPSTPTQVRPKSPQEIASELTWDEGGMGHVSFDQSTPIPNAPEPRIPGTITSLVAATPTKRGAADNRQETPAPTAAAANTTVPQPAFAAEATPAAATGKDGRRRRKAMREEEKELLRSEKAERKRKAAAEAAERKQKQAQQKQLKKDVIKRQKAELKFRKALLKRQRAEIKLLSKLDPELLAEEIMARNADAKRSSRRAESTGPFPLGAKVGVLPSLESVAPPAAEAQPKVGRVLSLTDADRPAPRRRPAERRWSLASVVGSMRRRRRSIASPESDDDNDEATEPLPPSGPGPAAAEAPARPLSAETGARRVITQAGSPKHEVELNAPPSASRVPRMSILKTKSGRGKSGHSAVGTKSRKGTRETVLGAAPPLVNRTNIAFDTSMADIVKVVPVKWASPSEGPRTHPHKPKSRMCAETSV